jgi:hypothetical protein
LSQPLDRLIGGLFQAFIVLAFTGLAVVGLAAMSAGVVAAWLGWAIAVFAAAMVVILLVVADMPPFTVFLPTLALGIALLVG